MKNDDKYLRVEYLCPWLHVRCEKFFAKDEKLACQHFVAGLQQDGCEDVRVHRPAL